jgi:hypothetical protein
MRNPERIPQVMSLLTLIWDRQPDTRFQQLIHNLQHEYAHKHGVGQKDNLWEKEVWRGIESYRKFPIVDLYNLEDEAFIEFLQEKVKECEQLDQHGNLNQ